MILYGLLWPMAALVVAVGGVSGLIRVDLIAVTMIRTIVPYALVAGISAAALVVFSLASEALANRAATKHPVALAMILQGLGVYTGIVSMRVIGLYYHHFKDRFAWSWD